MADELLRTFERALVAGDAAEVMRLGPAVLRIARTGRSEAGTAAPTWADSVKVADSNLSTATKNALHRVGADSAGRVADFTDNELLCISTIARTRLAEIRTWLGSLGLRTRIEGDMPRFDAPADDCAPGHQSWGRIKTLRSTPSLVGEDHSN